MLCLVSASPYNRWHRGARAMEVRGVSLRTTKPIKVVAASGAQLHGCRLRPACKCQPLPFFWLASAADMSELPLPRAQLKSRTSVHHCGPLCLVVECCLGHYLAQTPCSTCRGPVTGGFQNSQIVVSKLPGRYLVGFWSARYLGC